MDMTYRAIDAIFQRLGKIQTANGYLSDIGRRLYWGRVLVTDMEQLLDVQTDAEPEGVPFLTISENSASPQYAAEEGGENAALPYTEITSIEVSGVFSAVMNERVSVAQIRADVKRAMDPTEHIPGVDNLLYRGWNRTPRSAGAEIAAITFDYELHIPECQGIAMIDQPKYRS